MPWRMRLTDYSGGTAADFNGFSFYHVLQPGHRRNASCHQADNVMETSTGGPALSMGVISPRSADKRRLVEAELPLSVGKARRHGGRELGGVPEGSKIFHPLGGKIAGLILLCANSPRLRAAPRRCCSSLIPSR